MSGPAPYAGLKVLELARVLAGPWAGQALADMGADVIKVEGPAGDDTRRWGPPFITHGDGTRDAAYFHSCNRGKRGVVADFAAADDLAAVRALAAEADVIIENFKVGGLAKFGLDYASIAAINPAVVYCSVTGFGQSGPYAARPGYDFVVQGMSGIMDLTGDPAGAPQKMGVAFADIFTGLYATIAIQGALAHRAATGAGQHIDMALFDCMAGVLANQGMNALVGAQQGVPAATRMGNAHPNIAPYAVYPVADGWIILAVGNDGQFASLCRVLRCAAVAGDARFATNVDRVAHRDALDAALAEATAGWARDDLLDACAAANVPAGPINSVDEALADPQLAHRGLVAAAQTADGASVPTILPPFRLTGMGGDAPRAAPRHGAEALHGASWTAARAAGRANTVD